MNIIGLLPSPHQALRLTASLFKSTTIWWNYYGETAEACFLAAEYDVDADCGFFPRNPLPRLPPPFELWEKGLAEAPDVLYLGEDDDNVGIKERTRCDQWRQNVKSVSNSLSKEMERF